jgi:hypothetical protein
VVYISCGKVCPILQSPPATPRLVHQVLSTHKRPKSLLTAPSRNLTRLWKRVKLEDSHQQEADAEFFVRFNAKVSKYSGRSEEFLMILRWSHLDFVSQTALESPNICALGVCDSPSRINRANNPKIIRCGCELHKDVSKKDYHYDVCIIL